MLQHAIKVLDEVDFGERILVEYRFESILLIADGRYEGLVRERFGDTWVGAIALSGGLGTQLGIPTSSVIDIERCGRSTTTKKG